MKLPNVLFILIDDLGFGDVGFTQGSPPSATFTPNIDQLANDGLILDRHLAYKTCTPSRSALQSGRLPVHVTEQLKVPDNPNAGKKKKKKKKGVGGGVKTPTPILRATNTPTPNFNSSFYEPRIRPHPILTRRCFAPRSLTQQFLTT